MNRVEKGKIYYKTTFSEAKAQKATSYTKSFTEGKETEVIFSKSVRQDQDVFSFVGTKEIIDRDGDIVVIGGMDTENYEKNPIVLWGHDSRSTPIGKVVGLSRDLAEKSLIFDIVFAETEKGKEIKSLVSDGILNATSIGFMVNDLEYNEKTGALMLTDTELFEISIVNVPANPEALATDKTVEEVKEKTVFPEEELRNMVNEIVAEALAEAMKVEPEETEQEEDEQDKEPDKNENPSEDDEADPKEDDSLEVEEETAQGKLEAEPLIDYDRLAQAIAGAINPTTEEDEPTDTQPDEESSEEEPEDENHSEENEVPENEETPEPEEIHLESVENLEENDEFVVVDNEEEN